MIDEIDVINNFIPGVDANNFVSKFKEVEMTALAQKILAAKSAASFKRFCKSAPVNPVVSETPVAEVKYLFTAKECPNCKIAKQMLEGEDYVIIDAEENVELTKQYGVMQAPTLVVVGEEPKKYVNASNIQRFVDEQ